MDFKNTLKIVLGSKNRAPVIILRYPPNTDPVELMTSLLDLLPAPFCVYHMLSSHVPHEQAAEVVQNLQSGKTVVLISDTDGFAYQLAYAWDKYCEDPKYSYVTITETLNLNPSHTPEDLGHLLLLHPSDRDLNNLNGVFELNIRPEDLSKLVPTKSPIPISRIGIEPLKRNANLTIKDICFLHLRDEKPGLPDNMLEGLNSGQPLSWSMLQSVLKQGSSARDLLNFWYQTGQADDEKWLVGHEILDFLSDYDLTEPDTGIWKSIYDVVWSLNFIEGQGKVFRGQFDAQWPLVSTLYRPDSSGVLDIQTLHERVALTTAFIDRLRERSQDFFAAEPTEEELLAVAQHYGFATPLLDYSSSIKIAALFATQEAVKLVEGSKRIGVIYYMHPDRVEIGASSKTNLKESFIFSDFNLLEKSGIQVGNINFIAPKLKDLENRIARQHGLFLAESETRALKSVAIDRIFFRQHPGEVFEDPSASAEQTYILPADSALQALADEIKNRYDKPRVSPVLGQSKIPTPSILGSAGENLFGLLRHSSNFFEVLKLTFQENFGSLPKEDLAMIFNEYFSLCQTRASADVTKENLDPLRNALRKTAGILDVDPKWLTKMVEEKVGVLDHPYWEGGIPETSVQKEAAALSIGLFLASWEKLQHIRGQEATNLTLSATHLLQEYINR